MCYGGKCLHCISLEIGCLIMGYFQVVFFGVTALVFTGIDAATCLDPWWVGCSYRNGEKECHFEREPPMFCLHNTKVIPMSVLFFVFSSLLIYGVHNKKASFLMAYFAFGVVALAMSLIFFLVLTIVGHLPAIAGLLVGVVYSHLLVMVYQTAKKIDLGNVNTDQNPLAGTSSHRPINPPPYGKRGDGDVLEV